MYKSKEKRFFFDIDYFELLFLNSFQKIRFSEVFKTNLFVTEQLKFMFAFLVCTHRSCVPPTFACTCKASVVFILDFLFLLVSLVFIIDFCVCLFYLINVFCLLSNYFHFYPVVHIFFATFFFITFKFIQSSLSTFRYSLLCFLFFIAHFDLSNCNNTLRMKNEPERNEINQKAKIN